MSTTRTVTVYSTKGQRMQKIETDATKWGELRVLVANAGYDLKKLAGTENINKSVLSLDTVDDYVIPEGPFTLFLRPVQTKSGIEGTENMKWKELRQAVADAIAEDGDEARNHFVSGHPSGKNYTQLSTDELREVVASYVPRSERQPEAAAESETAQAEAEETATDNGVGAVVESVAELSDADRAQTAKNLLNAICQNTEDEDVCDMVEEATELIDAIIAELGGSNVSDNGQRALLEEQRRLDEEARQLFGGNY